MATITTEVPAENEAERSTAEASLQRLVQKLGAKGLIKLVDIYEKDVFVRMTVNKKLGIK